MEALKVQLDSLLTEEAYIGLIQPLLEKSEKTEKQILEDWRGNRIEIKDIFDHDHVDHNHDNSGKTDKGSLTNILPDKKNQTPKQTYNTQNIGFSETSETNASDRTVAKLRTRQRNRLR